MASGDFTNIMDLEADGSATVSHDTWADQVGSASTGAHAIDSDGNQASTSLDLSGMASGGFTNIMDLEADGSATISHDTWANKVGSANVYTYSLDSGGNLASTSLGLSGMASGDFTNIIDLEADGSATISHDTWANKVGSASVYTYAFDSGGNLASTYLGLSGMASGDFTNIMDLEADSSSIIGHKTWANQVGSASVSTYVVDSEGNQATTSLDLGGMGSGDITNIIDLEADGSATVAHDTWANKVGSASVDTSAVDSDGNQASTSLDLGGMASGDFTNIIDLEADGSATVAHDTWANKVGSASVDTSAVDSDGNQASTSLDLGGMASGDFTNIIDLEADGSATVAHDTWANKVGSASVDTSAVDSDGNQASTSLDLGGMASGDFTNIIDLQADGSATVAHDTWANKVGSASVDTSAVDSDGNQASTSLDLGGMASGDFTNIIDQEADGSATVAHHTWANKVGSASVDTSAVDSDGNQASTSLDLGGMASGDFTNIIDLEADGSATIGHDTWATKIGYGNAAASAKDSDNSQASTLIDVKGASASDFTNLFELDADGGASISHEFAASGDSIQANTKGWNSVKQSYIETLVSKNTASDATLSGKQTAYGSKTATDADQYITARGRISSDVRASTGGSAVKADLDYDSVGVDTHLMARTDSSGAKADRWTKFYLDDNVGSETIQSTVDEAYHHEKDKRDFIDIAEGIYYENVVIDKSLILKGHSSQDTTVDGNRNGRVFTLTSTLHPDSVVDISDLTIQHGYLRGADAYGTGSADAVGESVSGGGIYNSVELTLTRSIVKDNEIQGGDGFGADAVAASGDSAKGGDGSGGDAKGAGIYNEGSLTLSDSDVLNNIAKGGNGYGGEGKGSASSNAADGTSTNDATTPGNPPVFPILNIGIGKISDPAVESSSQDAASGGSGMGGDGVGGAGIGGGIYNDHGTITILNSEIMGNTAQGGAGYGGDGIGGTGGNGGKGGNSGDASNGEAVGAFLWAGIGVGVGGDAGSAADGGTGGAGGSGVGGKGIGGEGSGAGIFNQDGTLIVSGSTIEDNAAQGGIGLGGDGRGGQGGLGGIGGNAGDGGDGKGIGVGIGIGFLSVPGIGVGIGVGTSGKGGQGGNGKDGGAGGLGLGGEGVGGQSNGAGIFSQGTLQISDSVIEGNSALGGKGQGGSGYGGKGGDGRQGGSGGDGNAEAIGIGGAVGLSQFSLGAGVGVGVTLPGDGGSGGNGGAGGDGNGGHGTGGDTSGAGIFSKGDTAISNTGISKNTATCGFGLGGDGLGGEGGNGGLGGSGGNGDAKGTGGGVAIDISKAIGIGIGVATSLEGDGGKGGNGGIGGQAQGGDGTGGRSNGAGLHALDGSLSMQDSQIKNNIAEGGAGTGGNSQGGDGGNGGEGGAGGRSMGEASGGAFGCSIIGLVGGLIEDLANLDKDFKQGGSNFDLGAGIGVGVGVGGNGGQGGDAGYGGQAQGGNSYAGSAQGAGVFAEDVDASIKGTDIVFNKAAGGDGIGGNANGGCGGIGGQGGQGGKGEADTGGGGGLQASIDSEIFIDWSDAIDWIPGIPDESTIPTGFSYSAPGTGIGFSTGVAIGGSGGAGGSGGQGGIAHGGVGIGGNAMGGGIYGQESIIEIRDSSASENVAQGGDGLGGVGLGGKGNTGGSGGDGGDASGSSVREGIFYEKNVNFENSIDILDTDVGFRVKEVGFGLGGGINMGVGIGIAGDGGKGGQGGQGGQGLGGKGLGGEASGGSIYSDLSEICLQQSSILENDAIGGRGYGGDSEGGKGGNGGTGGDGGVGSSEGKPLELEKEFSSQNGLSFSIIVSGGGGLSMGGRGGGGGVSGNGGSGIAGDGQGGNAKGGAVYNHGEMSIKSSQINGNDAKGGLSTTGAASGGNGGLGGSGGKGGTGDGTGLGVGIGLGVGYSQAPFSVGISFLPTLNTGGFGGNGGDGENGGNGGAAVGGKAVGGDAYGGGIFSDSALSTENLALAGNHAISGDAQLDALLAGSGGIGGLGGIGGSLGSTPPNLNLQSSLTAGIEGFGDWELEIPLIDVTIPLSSGGLSGKDGQSGSKSSDGSNIMGLAMRGTALGNERFEP
ncbi:MAG: hypothetical protein HPY61_14770 [Methanotrichaceae archaeon]|nr:hypothetical protein [Methanotrichaceae archaeon]